MRFPANLPNSTESEGSAVSAEGRDVGLNDATAFKRRADRLSSFKNINTVRSTQLNADGTMCSDGFGLRRCFAVVVVSSTRPAARQTVSHHESGVATAR